MTSTFSTVRFAALGTLDPGESAALLALAGPPERFAPGAVIRSEGDAPGAYLLHEGWVLGSERLPDGARQICKVHLPGDMLGMPSLPFATAVETLTALTSASVSAISLPALARMFVDHPRLALLMFLGAQQERVRLMDGLTAVGRLDAKRRVAALLVNLHARMRLSDPTLGNSFVMPLTQAQIADVMGLTPIHVNRVTRALERDGELIRAGRTITIVDPVRLRAFAGLPDRVVKRDHDWLAAANGDRG